MQIESSSFPDPTKIYQGVADRFELSIHNPYRQEDPLTGPIILDIISCGTTWMARGNPNIFLNALGLHAKNFLPLGILIIDNDEQVVSPDIAIFSDPSSREFNRPQPHHWPIFLAIPTSFINQTFEKPILTIAQTAQILSVLRDFHHGRHLIESPLAIQTRSFVAMSAVYHQASYFHPTISTPQEIMQALRAYPGKISDLPYQTDNTPPKLN